MTFTPGQAVRWYRDKGHGRVQIVPAVIVRKISDKSAVIRTDDDWQHTVRIESLMPASDPETPPPSAA